MYDNNNTNDGMNNNGFDFSNQNSQQDSPQTYRQIEGGYVVYSNMRPEQTGQQPEGGRTVLQPETQQMGGMTGTPQMGNEETAQHSSEPDFQKPINETGNIPRWQPEQPEPVTPPQADNGKMKNNRGLLITLIAIVAVLIIGVVCFGIIGYKKVTAMVSQSKNASTLSTADSSSLTDESGSAGNGYVLTNVSAVVDEVIPSVVSITSRAIIYNNDIWGYFFGGNRNQGSSSEEVEAGIGSGTIVGENETELLILTSYHVVEGCSSLYVTYIDQTDVEGYIKASSAENDIAIVAVQKKDIPEETMNSIKIATLSTANVKVGEGVIVIGNALGYGMSVTTGIVSATERTIIKDDNTINVIQTDAAINSGNSGGCMLNSKGEVIGISEAKIVIESVEGMCYAIPVASNIELIQELMNTESPKQAGEETTVSTGQGAYLGIMGRDITSELSASYDMPQGIYIAGTVQGGGAEKAGLLEGDIITSFDGTYVTTMDELKSLLTGYKPGDTVVITVQRNTGNGYREENINVTLTETIS